MVRTTVVCMVLAATFGITGTVNSGIAAAAPVARERTHVPAAKGVAARPKPTVTLTLKPVSVSASASARAPVRKPGGVVRKPAGVVRRPAGVLRKLGSTKVVRYDGYTFTVPAGWPVYRLGPGSTRCVRYDTSAVYLGTPGKNQECPAQLVGQADTVSIDASSAPAQRGRPVIELQSAEVGAQVTSQPDPRPGLSVTATYGASPGTVRQILHSVRSAHTGAAVAIQQSAVAAPPPAAAAPAASSTPAKAPVRRARVHAGARLRAPRRTVLLSPWARAFARVAPRWYRALWYLRAWAYYLGDRPWSPTARVPGVPPQPRPASAAAAPAGHPVTAGHPALAGHPAPKPTVTSSAAAAATIAPEPSATPKPTGIPKPTGTPKPGKPGKPGHGKVPTTPLRAPGSPLPGFDTCTAPSLQAMHAWRHTYSVAAIYIGGAEMACDYGNLSASWVKAVTAMGWSLIPLYVGLQAPCNGFSAEIQSNSAASEGTGSAKSAIADAQSFGLGRGTPIYFDMEAYNSGNKGCRNSVLSFLNHWTRQLHSRGYISGVYSSAASGAEDLGNATSVYGHQVAKPDSMWFALWDDKANLVGTPYLLNSWWSPDRRIKQYKGTHSVKVDGVKLSIDSDWVQGPVY